jgi:SAM-dependent methyltransferase
MKDFWNQRYAKKEYAYGIEPNTFFRAEIDKLRKGNLLLPGEGEGRNAVYAAKHGWEVTAVDFSVKAKVKANKLAVKHNVEIKYIVESLNKAELPDDYFDAVAFISVHLNDEDLEKGMQKIFKSMKSRATFIFECFSEKQLGRKTGGPKTIDRLYSVAQIRRVLNDLNIDYLQEVEIPMDEGEYHRGRAMVIRAIATKP